MGAPKTPIRNATPEAARENRQQRMNNVTQPEPPGKRNSHRGNEDSEKKKRKKAQEDGAEETETSDAQEGAHQDDRQPGTQEKQIKARAKTISERTLATDSSTEENKEEEDAQGQDDEKPSREAEPSDKKESATSTAAKRCNNPREPMQKAPKPKPTVTKQRGSA